MIFLKMLYIPNVRKNLNDKSLLVFGVYSIIIKSNKLIITHNIEFVGEDLNFEDLFTLGVFSKILIKMILLFLIEPSNI